LSAAAAMLAEARTMDEIKAIHDIATAAQVYARAAHIGMEAQNHAAEIRLLAERKAGELLKQLEKKPGARTDTTSTIDGQGSEYRTVLLWYNTQLAHLPPGKTPGVRIPNHDGSSDFCVFDVQQLPSNFLIARTS
jgi:hypothetical protein